MYSAISICLLIIDMLQGALKPGRPNRSFEFWRDQNKIRGRFFGVGNGVVVARLNIGARCAP
jgi:hypothetical protein